MGLTNTQYHTILREYDNKQLRNHHQVVAHVQEVYAKAPKLKEIDNEVSSASVDATRQLLEGNEDALSQLNEKIAALKQKRVDILTSLGYSEQYFEPDYDCADCKDTGYIGTKKCHCFRQRAIDLVYTQSNLKRILEKENFEHYSDKYYSDELINPATNLSAKETANQAFAACKEFIRTFDDTFSNLFFYGDTGVGKTFLSNCIAKELLDTGHSVIYFTAFQLFDIFEKSTFHHKSDEEFLIAHQNIFDCDLLIIDDLGTEFPNSFTISQLFSCLNERILRRKSTIISSNLGIQQIADIYSERIFSRISKDYTMIKLFGDDIRIQQRILK